MFYIVFEIRDGRVARAGGGERYEKREKTPTPRTYSASVGEGMAV